MGLIENGELTVMGNVVLVSYFVFLFWFPILAFIFTYIREKLKRKKTHIGYQGYCVGIEYLGYHTKRYRNDNGRDTYIQMNDYSYIFEYEMNNIKHQTERKKDGVRPSNFNIDKAVDYAPNIVRQGDMVTVFVNKDNWKDTYIPKFDGGFNGKAKEAFTKAFVRVCILGLLSIAGLMGLLIFINLG